MKPIDRAALEAAGFTEEPPPDIVLLRAERCRHQPAGHGEVGLVRVRYQHPRSGSWHYDDVPVEAVVG